MGYRAAWGGGGGGGRGSGRAPQHYARALRCNTAGVTKLKFLIVFMLFGLPLHFYQIITGDLNIPQYKKYRGS